MDKATAGRYTTVQKSLEEAERKTNIFLSYLLLCSGAVYLIVGIVNVTSSYIFNSIWFDFCYGIIVFSDLILFLICLRRKGQGKWIRPLLSIFFLVNGVVMNLLHGSSVENYLLVQFIAARYCDKRFSTRLAVCIWILSTVCSCLYPYIYWHLGAVDLCYYRFPGDALIHFDGWRATNLGDYMTAWEYTRSFIMNNVIIASAVMAVCSACCVLFAKYNYDMLLNQQRMDEQLAQAEIDSSKNKAELLESNSRLLISQIQPHFIYNVLNTIYHLCDLDSGMAQEAIVDFSDYLRTNLNALSGKETVPFDRELDHIRTYLRLENMRFGDRLKVVWDLEVTNFRVPELGIQPLVENAVKHGVCAKAAGGTVTIAARESRDGYRIVVQDDGVGFDTNSLNQLGEEHVGLRNIRTRLEILCNATLKIQSAKGEGTTAIITIPKDKEAE